MSIRIRKTGGACQLVDGGRWGFQRWGIPVGGAMDPVMWRLACALAGQPRPGCAIEVTLGGTELDIGNKPTLVAVAGLLSHVYVDEVEVPANRPMWVAPGARIRIPRLEHCSWCYIALGHTFAIEPLLGSYGPLPGCGAPLPFTGILPSGTELPFVLDGIAQAEEPFGWPRDDRVAWPTWGVSVQSLVHSEYDPIRFVLNAANPVPQKVVDAFIGQVWRVSPEMDRQGLRLEGRALPELPQLPRSEATVQGTIQVPPNGQPILLAADRQPTGGYPVMGAVATVDHGQLGRLRPGAHISFTPISHQRAQELALKQHRQLEVCEADIRKRLQVECGVDIERGRA